MAVKSLVPKALKRVLVHPFRISRAMNLGLRKRSIVSLNIHKDRIGVAVASHNDINSLPAIPVTGRLMKSNEHAEQLSRICEEHDVCGFVVSWPVQNDTGKMGFSCGRVLYTLDTFLKQSQTLFTPERPICLWDSFRSENTRLPVDKFGRCVAFGHATEKTLHLASEEQYNQDENTTATELLEDFCEENLPALTRRMTKLTKERRGSRSHNLVSDWKKHRVSNITATL